MPAPYDYDLRTKAIEAVKRGEKKLHVAQMLNISRNTLDLWLKREEETGDYQAIANTGRPQKIKEEKKFREFVKENKDKTQEQMAELWGDEAGFDNRDDYPYGYSPKGEKCYALKSGKKRERTSWISALREKKLFAPLTFEGSCNRDLFEFWLEYCLIPQLNPGDIIIIDNATFHKGENIRKMVEEAGCEIWYLPAYSPDLNKIENWWAVLKTWMKQRLKQFDTVRECVDAAFKNCPNVFA
jgi:transposase